MGTNDVKITTKMSYGFYGTTVDTMKKICKKPDYKPGKQYLSNTYDQYTFKTPDGKTVVTQIGYEDTYCNPEIKLFAIASDGYFTYSAESSTTSLNSGAFKSVNKFNRIDTPTQYAIDINEDGKVDENEIFDKHSCNVIGKNLIDYKY